MGKIRTGVSVTQIVSTWGIFVQVPLPSHLGTLVIPAAQNFQCLTTPKDCTPETLLCHFILENKHLFLPL